MADSILRDKSKAFAKEVVFLCRRLKQNNVEGSFIKRFINNIFCCSACIFIMNNIRQRATEIANNKLIYI
ncbi:MAG: hypothetical protein IJN17_07745 [Clostridia bacterium]|nr:hypothetical protein [Clostridia bacterium]